jgi:hypothetical protein
MASTAEGNENLTAISIAIGNTNIAAKARPIATTDTLRMKVRR